MDRSGLIIMLLCHTMEDLKDRIIIGWDQSGYMLLILLLMSIVGNDFGQKTIFGRYSNGIKTIVYTLWYPRELAGTPIVIDSQKGLDKEVLVYG